MLYVTAFMYLNCEVLYEMCWAVQCLVRQWTFLDFLTVSCSKVINVCIRVLPHPGVAYVCILAYQTCAYMYVSLIWTERGVDNIYLHKSVINIYNIRIHICIYNNYNVKNLYVSTACCLMTIALLQ